MSRAAPSQPSVAGTPRGPHVFVRDDGARLHVVEGFRQRMLSAPRTSVQPKAEWTATDYEAAAEKKIRRSRRLVAELQHWGGSLEGASVLEVGCGAGIDSLLLGLHPVERVVGIDRDLVRREQRDRNGAPSLTRVVLEKAGSNAGVDDVLRRRPVEFVRMDATALGFPDDSFDVLVSRAALEHLIPIERALAEMARVVRPGGLLYHGIDPFYWLRGCHKGGLVDIPWAHARLAPDDFRRLVATTEGEKKADRRSRHLATLNQLGLRQWRKSFEGGPFEVVDWRQERSPLAEAVLAEYPDVLETLLAGVSPADLVHSSIKVWLRKRRDTPRSEELRA